MVKRDNKEVDKKDMSWTKAPQKQTTGNYLRPPISVNNRDLQKEKFQTEKIFNFCG